jgi:uncharacterized membrane protein SirB2
VSWYPILKALHVGSVALSVGLFALRGGLMLAGSALLARPLLRVGPHVVDSVLLASAVALTLVIGQYPFVASWLTAKVLALPAYIALGSLALRPGRGRWLRAGAFAAALAVVAYILATALHHDPDPRRW